MNESRLFLFPSIYILDVVTRGCTLGEREKEEKGVLRLQYDY